MTRVESRDFGWLPDVADHRDYRFGDDHVSALLAKSAQRARRDPKLPETVDWREYCGPIEDQQSLPTSSAHACTGLIQYCERRASGCLGRASNLFAYQNACRLLGVPKSSSIPLRAQWKAIVRCGTPPDRYWPYDEARLACEPDAFTFTFQREFRALRYFRLDGGNATGEQVLARVRSFLAGGLPIVFGITIGSAVDGSAEIPFPARADSVLGGQAVMAVGYNDKLRIRSDRGALAIRNSWGINWGDDGYGWLPYSYVLERLARDFWTALKPAWLRSGEFELPRD